MEFISPGGLERFFEERGRLKLSRPLSEVELSSLANRYGSPFQPELIPELVNTYGVHPQPPWPVGDRASGADRRCVVCPTKLLDRFLLSRTLVLVGDRPKH